MKSGNLNSLEPSGPLQACNGTALPLPLHSPSCRRLFICCLGLLVVQMTLPQLHEIISRVEIYFFHQLRYSKRCTTSGTIRNIEAVRDCSVLEERLSLGLFYTESKSKALCIIRNDTTKVLKHCDIRRLSNIKFNTMHIPGVITG